MSIRKIISGRLSRGRVDLNINIEHTAATAYEINRALIAGYINALRDIQTEFNLSGDVDINTLTRLPGALATTREGLDETVTASVERALNQALDDLERMRAAEGSSLADEMRTRLANIEAAVPTIEGAAAGLVDAYRQRLQKRITELLARGGDQNIELDAGRLAQEVASPADRSDIIGRAHVLPPVSS